MAIIPAVMTQDFRKYMPRFIGGKLGISSGLSTATGWNPLIKGFKVGEGGWIDPGTGAVPRTPNDNIRFELVDNGLQDLDIVVDQKRTIGKRYTATPNYQSSFYKSLSASDAELDLVSPNKIRIRCLLDFGEFNLNDAGVAPHIWEIGIFMEHPEYYPGNPPSPVNPGQVEAALLMIAYGTFPLEIKDSTKQIEHYVVIVD